MRVDDRSSTDAARLGSTAETQKARQSASLLPGSDAACPDRLQLSTLTERIRTMFEAAAASHAARLAEVSAQVRAGTYRVDCQALGRELAAEALS
jgi:hypothetical protein